MECVKINGEHEVEQALQNINNKNVNKYKLNIIIETCKLCKISFDIIKHNKKTNNDNKKIALSIVVYCFIHILGLKSSEIANELNKSKKTIDLYRAKLKKLDEQSKIDKNIIDKIKLIETKIYSEINKN